MTIDGKLLVCALLLCGVSSPVISQEFVRGQELYENQCRTCHESWAHQRKGRSVVASMHDLHQRVAAWATHSGLDWSSEEIDDVADYLNQTYYHFEMKE
jgi:mono/diheme cytochrome c family protein